MFQTFLIDGKNKRYAMIKIGNFEIEYDKNVPDAVTVKIETDKNGEVWLPKCDIARAYGVFVQSVNAGLKSLAKTGDFDEYRDVRVEHFTYNNISPITGKIAVWTSTVWQPSLHWDSA